MPEYIVKVQVELIYIVDEADDAGAEEQVWHWDEITKREENVVSFEIKELPELEEGEEWDPDIEILRNEGNNSVAGPTDRCLPSH